MASSELAQQSNNGESASATLLAVVVTFNSNETKLLSGDHPDSPSHALKDYCGRVRNGCKGDVSTVIYPWQEDENRGLVIFDNELTPAGSNNNNVVRMMTAATAIFVGGSLGTL